jgi:hypothetical protein
MTIQDQEVLEAQSKANAEERVKAARDAMLAEQAEHRATMAKEAEKSKSELDLYLGELTKPEQKQVRLHAFLQFMNGDMSDVSNKQVAVDLLALRLARYMVTGEAK